MAPTIADDEIDDLLYFARTGDKEEFDTMKDELCKREKINVVELLEVAKDAQSGNGIMHMAAANGHDVLLRQLCKILSSPSPQNPTMLAILNAQNQAGNTALHWAALNGHLESVKVLLEEGADPTITNQRGHDAVFEAELNDKKDVVEWVLKEGGEGLEEGFGGESAEGEADENMESEEGRREGDGEGDGAAAGTNNVEEELSQMDIQDVPGKS